MEEELLEKKSQQAIKIGDRRKEELGTKCEEPRADDVDEVIW